MTTSNLSRALPAALLVVGMGIAIVLAVHWWGFTMDDSYISLRYSWHLAHGNGPVFNVGERVEGFSNPLLVFAVAALALVGVPYLVAAKLLGLAALLGVLFFVFRLVQHSTENGMVAGLSSIAVAAYLPLVVWSVSGLETSLYACALVAAVYAVARDKYLWAGVAMGLACLTRPEAPLLAGVAALWLLRNRPALTAYAGGLAAVFGPYLVFRVVYYGFPLPNTFYAKMGGDALERVKEGWKYFAGFAASAFAIMVASIPVETTRPAPWKLIAFSIALVQCAFSIYSGGDWMPVYRFLVPIVPLLVVLALSVRIERSWWRYAYIAAVFVASVAIGQSPSHTQALATMIQLNHTLTLGPTTPATQCGQWLRDNAKGKDVCASQVGWLSWQCPETNIVDFIGLTDATIAHAPGNHAEKVLPSYLNERQPEYVVLWCWAGTTDSVSRSERLWLSRRAEWFDGKYREVKRFGIRSYSELPSVAAQSEPLRQYVVFQRVTRPAIVCIGDSITEGATGYAGGYPARPHTQYQSHYFEERSDLVEESTCLAALAPEAS